MGGRGEGGGWGGGGGGGGGLEGGGGGGGATLRNVGKTHVICYGPHVKAVDGNVILATCTLKHTGQSIDSGQ